MALAAGTITPEQFVDLNQKIGGIDIDHNFIPQRTQADLPAVYDAYRAGFTHGARLANVPMIDALATGTDDADIHQAIEPWILRARWRSRPPEALPVTHPASGR